MTWDPYKWTDDVKIHGTLMLLGWGFFIPLSSFVNSHLYKSNRTSHKLGVYFHMVFGAIGLILALTGFGFGISKFSTLSRDGVSTYEMTHAVLGIIATAGGILQLVLIGHFSHCGLGFLWMLLAFAALETGTHITNINLEGYEDLADQNEKWSGAFLGTTFSTILTTAAIVCVIPRLVSPPRAGALNGKPEYADRKGRTVHEEVEEISSTA
jgi:hypothetical protein